MAAPRGWYVDEDLLDVYRVLRSARRNHGDALGVFRLRWRGQLQSWDRVKLVFDRWDDMVKAWDEHPRPFICRVSRFRPPTPVDL